MIRGGRALSRSLTRVHAFPRRRRDHSAASPRPPAGVDATIPQVGETDAPGYGGLPASKPAIPAVVVEGWDDAKDAWVEVPFRYAPFGETRAPRRTAPHQPRLDWQMWFAALGAYQHNPWFLHLLYRITIATPATDPALALLDGDAYPFSKPPARVRASLYHYDFTRVSSFVGLGGTLKSRRRRDRGVGAIPVPRGAAGRRRSPSFFHFHLYRAARGRRSCLYSGVSESSS